MFLYCTSAPVVEKDNRYYILLPSILYRYRNAFGAFRLIARRGEWSDTLPLVDVTDCIADALLVDSRMDELLPSRQIVRRITEMVNASSVVGLRIPAFMCNKVFEIAKKNNRPVLAEVMGCPWDMFWNHGIKGKCLAGYMTRKTKQIARNSEFVHYVTEEFLQKRYPVSAERDVISCGVSDVRIPDISETVVKKRIGKIRNMDKRSITVMTSAAVNVIYKGQQYMIEAIKILSQRGINVKYVMAGGGSRDYLAGIAEKCGVASNIEFAGQLSSEEIIRRLDECDIYVQPSLQEGLPRSVVEALSRGCPAVGARTGGIPELLPEECVVKRKSSMDIADTIEKMLSEGLEKYSEASFRRARDFEQGALNKKFDSFYSEVRQRL